MARAKKKRPSAESRTKVSLPEKTSAAALPTAPLPPPRIKIASQEYAVVPVDRISPHPKNPKKGNLEAIGESMEANDFYGAAVVQKSTGHILAGNHRWRAARDAGLREIPVILVDVEDDAAERILSADNRVAELGSYDEKLRLELLESRARDGGLRGTGYADADLLRLRTKFEPKPPAPPTFNDPTVRHQYHCPACGHVWTGEGRK